VYEEVVETFFQGPIGWGKKEQKEGLGRTVSVYSCEPTHSHKHRIARYDEEGCRRKIVHPHE